MNVNPGILQLIKTTCTRRKLDYQLMCALIEVESSFNTYAVRFEPVQTPDTDDPVERLRITTSNQARAFHPEKFAKKNGITLITEIALQRCSVGLGQVLGSTARSLGFDGPLLKLCDPNTGIFWSCEAFERPIKPCHSIEEEVASYNAGTARIDKATGKLENQGYVDKVMKLYMAKKY